MFVNGDGSEATIAHAIDNFIEAVPERPLCEGREKKLLRNWKYQLLDSLANCPMNFSQPRNRAIAVHHINLFERDLSKGFFNEGFDENGDFTKYCAISIKPFSVKEGILQEIKSKQNPPKPAYVIVDTTTKGSNETKPKGLFHDMGNNLRIELGLGQHRRIGYRQASLRKMRTYGRASEGGEYF